MSRLTTVVCALSAIVTIVDYVTAKPLFANWLARQVSRTPDGWQVSPALNLAALAGFAALVWMATGAETPAGDVRAAARLFRRRACLLACGLGLWFFFGPAVGSPPPPLKTPLPPVRTAPPIRGASSDFAESSSPTVPHPHRPGVEDRGAVDYTRGKGPFGPPRDGAAPRGWRPGDGLRVMSNLIEDWLNPPPPEPPRIGR